MIIDADSHFISIDTFKYVPEQYRNKLPIFDMNNSGILSVNLQHDPNAWSNLKIRSLDWCSEIQGLSDVDKRIEDFKLLGIDFQILNPQEHALRFSYAVDKQLAEWMCFSYNRTLLEIIQKYPNKFSGPILLPLQNIDWCLKEIDWAIENKIYSVIIDLEWMRENQLYSSLLLEIPGIDKFFKKCEENDILISCHGQMHRRSFKGNEIFHSYRIHDLFPCPYTLLICSIVLSDVFEKFPNLKILISESNITPILKSFRHIKKHLGTEKTVDRIKKNLWFTIETEKKELIECIDLFGSERFLFATDYPHDDDGGKNKFIDHKLIKNLNLPTSDIENICYKNALQIFRLDMKNEII